MINKDKARNAIYSAAGVYMLYTAWMLYGNLDDADGDGTLFLIFTIVFALAGVALIALGLWNLYKENGKTGSQSGTDENQSATGDTPEDTAESDAAPDSPDDVQIPAAASEEPDDSQIPAAAATDNVQIPATASADDELTPVKSAPDNASSYADARNDPRAASVQETHDSAEDLRMK
ncbi:MAG: hypothetical protein LUF30_10780 [Lachnospiraceae bacterium]|nr:hypothetical protein [Lachnospiraceae bacterium]